MSQHMGDKEERIRDPVHGLIVFSPAEDLDRLIWDLINCVEFQRLRRIKQLGFSEFVYPGATHTRFAHSLGVYETARSLVRRLKDLLEDFDRDKADIAICAALLHDLGHGPFSHAFEHVLRKRGILHNHEKWTKKILEGDTQIGQLLAERFEVLGGEVIKLLDRDDPSDIYDSIVSSQFDADRLD